MCVIKNIQDYACSPQLCRINEKQIWSLHVQPRAADWFFLSGHWLYMRRIKRLNPSSLLHSSFLFHSLTLKPEDDFPLKSSFGPSELLLACRNSSTSRRKVICLILENSILHTQPTAGVIGDQWQALQAGLIHSHKLTTLFRSVVLSQGLFAYYNSSHPSLNNDSSSL